MIPAYLLVHTATVEPWEGTGAYGDIYGAPFELECWVEDVVRLVRSPDGEEVVSSARLYCNPGTVIPARSRVTVNDRPSTVLTTSTYTSGGLVPIDHIEVSLS